MKDDISLTLKDDLAELFLLLAEEIKKVPTTLDSPVIEESSVDLPEEPFIPPIEKINLSVKSDDLSDFFHLFEQKSPAIEEKPIVQSIVEQTQQVIPKLQPSITEVSASDINNRINKLIADTNKKLQKLIEHSTLAYGGGSGSYWLNDLGDTDHDSIIAAEHGDVLIFDATKNKWIASGTLSNIDSLSLMTLSSNTGIIQDLSSNTFSSNTGTFGVLSSNILNSNTGTFITLSSNTGTFITFSSDTATFQDLSSNTLSSNTFVTETISANTISVDQNLYVRTQKQILSNLTGNTVNTTGIIIPSGSYVMGVTSKVLEQLSANGYSIGTVNYPTLWGTKTSNTVGTITKSSDYSAFDAIGLFTENSNVMISTTGDAFTNGSIEISTFYFITDPN